MLTVWQDLQKATNIARTMVTELGMSTVIGDANMKDGYQHMSSTTKELIEKEIRRIIQESRARVVSVLTDHRKELDLLAKALIEYESLNIDEMRKVIAGEKLTGKLTILLPVPPIKLPEGTVFTPNTPPLDGSAAAKAVGAEKERGV